MKARTNNQADETIVRKMAAAQPAPMQTAPMLQSATKTGRPRSDAVQRVQGETICPRDWRNCEAS